MKMGTIKKINWLFDVQLSKLRGFSCSVVKKQIEQAEEILLEEKRSGRQILGDILKDIYDHEEHLRIEWMWDGGIDVYSIWKGDKEDKLIGHHESEPSKAIKEAYKYFEGKWKEAECNNCKHKGNEVYNSKGCYGCDDSHNNFTPKTPK